MKNLKKLKLVLRILLCFPVFMAGLGMFAHFLVDGADIIHHDFWHGVSQIALAGICLGVGAISFFVLYSTMFKVIFYNEQEK